MDEVADKDDLLGIDDTVRRTAFFSPRPATRNKASVFTRGARNSLLAELDSPIIVPLTAKDGVVEATSAVCACVCACALFLFNRLCT